MENNKKVSSIQFFQELGSRFSSTLYSLQEMSAKDKSGILLYFKTNEELDGFSDEAVVEEQDPFYDSDGGIDGGDPDYRIEDDVTAVADDTVSDSDIELSEEQEHPADGSLPSSSGMEQNLEKSSSTTALESEAAATRTLSTSRSTRYQKRGKPADDGSSISILLNKVQRLMKSKDSNLKILPIQGRGADGWKYGCELMIKQN